MRSRLALLCASPPQGGDDEVVGSGVDDGGEALGDLGEIADAGDAVEDGVEVGSVRVGCSTLAGWAERLGEVGAHGRWRSAVC
jgi:hypothetical protein